MPNSLNDRHEFRPLLVEIEDAPLNPLGRLMLWSVVVLLLLIGLWLWFGQIDVVITARGRIIPLGEVKVVQPLRSGIVRDIRITAGQAVVAGDLLFEIDPTEIEPELQSLRADLAQAELEMQRLRALLAGKSFVPAGVNNDAVQVEVQRALYRSNLEQLRRQQQIQKEELVRVKQQSASVQRSSEQTRQQLVTAQQRLERLETVRDLISRDVYEQAVAEVDEQTTQLALDQHRLAELQAAEQQTNEQLRLVEQEQRNRWLAELAEKQRNSSYLRSQIERTGFVNARQQIRAPVSGYVSKLMVHTPGAVVSPAEKLAEIVPDGVPRIFRAQVLNRDVGFLAEGMQVAIKIDTYEFQKYGTLQGHLQQVARNSVENERLGLVYDVDVEPLATTLPVDGREAEVAVGMSGTAEIKVGQRRLIEFFIYPLIRSFSEGTSVR